MMMKYIMIMKSKIGDKIKSVVYREQFQPSIIGMFVNPFYITRKELFKHIGSFSHLVKGRVLDIGCGQNHIIIFSHPMNT
jgi:2-polyprenyl-3-methyl-5-hydroxy-6-metoxy-1,4-benzoquinol methylase